MMSRLTKKLTTNSNYEIQLLQRGLTYVTNTPYNEQIIHKLGQLEDLEDELGCPLEVVFKAKKNGVHIKIDDEEIDIEGWKLSIYLKEQCFIINEMLFKTKLPFSDHKKTWWLKSDRSE